MHQSACLSPVPSTQVPLSIKKVQTQYPKRHRDKMLVQHEFMHDHVEEFSRQHLRCVGALLRVLGLPHRTRRGCGSPQRVGCSGALHESTAAPALTSAAASLHIADPCCA